MNIAQDYLVSIMKGHFSLYETRLFSRIVMHANHIIKGQRITSLMGKSLALDGINCNMAIPITEILTDGSHNYQAVIEAAKSLQDKVIEYYDRSTSKWTYYRDHIINRVEHTEGSGVIQFTVSVWLLKYILGFIENSSNFSIYDFESALKIPSPYAVRLYWLTCSMTSPVNYPISMLRGILGTGNKYTQNRDFIKRCIEPSRKTLEELGLNGFCYTKSAERGDKAYLHIIPVKRQPQTKNQLTAQAGLGAWVHPAIKNYLLAACNFTMDELRRNKSTLMDFCRVPNCENELVRIVNRARKKRAGKGYIINGMKTYFTANKDKLH